jgi:hypothetical protein
MKTLISDLKIRFADETSEMWLPFWLSQKDVCEHDWSAMQTGMEHYVMMSARDKNDNCVCEAWLYRTKTQRVICIMGYAKP